MKVAVIHNRDHSGVIRRLGQECSEHYSEKAIANVVLALSTAGHEVQLFDGDKNLLARLEQWIGSESDCIAFNMAYGIQGECRYTHLPAMLEMAGIPYTGSTPLGHALALDKIITKQLLRDAAIPTPAYCVMRTGDEECGDLRFPVVVKPRHESTSFGLQLVDDRSRLGAAVREIASRYEQDALVEEYIEGREVCVALLGNGDDIRALPIVEQDFTGRAVRMVTWEDKVHGDLSEPRKICPARIPPALAVEITRLAVETFRICRCRDYARVDVRIDRDGRPFILEINSMASLGVTGSYVLAAKTAGYAFDALVNAIVAEASRRYSRAADESEGVAGGFGDAGRDHDCRARRPERADCDRFPPANVTRLTPGGRAGSPLAWITGHADRG